jgi:phospholipase C
MKISLVGSILLGAVSTTALFGGCSSAGSPHDPGSSGSENIGTVGLQLQVGEGVTLNTLSYTITGPAEFNRMGTIDVSGSTTISATIGGIPFGSGYLISLSGHSLEGTAMCAGSASFDVTSAATVQVPIHVTCSVQPGTGSISVTGTINACPTITTLGASPTAVTTGSSLSLTSAAVDADSGPSPLSYSWTSTSGALANAASQNPTFTCAQAGTATITLSVFDGDAACSSHQSVDVTCTEPATASPIKHVIVLIGENRSFDHTFGTYVPVAGQSVSNLLSKGIVNADGTPGPNFALAAQATATPESKFYVGADSRTPYAVLPQPTTNGAPQAQRATAGPFQTVDQVAAIESDLAPEDLVLATTGATGLPARTLDTRITNAANLPNGPFQLSGPTMPYDAYTGDLTHRFYQMWQQEDCAVPNATPDDPAGCAKDLFPFVLTTFSTANNGQGNPMAFYNVQGGDVPYLKSLADTYAMSDNFHQSFMGGTGANHSMVGFGDAVPWTDGNDNPVPPPVGQIANPDPKAGTNNNYTVDGAFSDCSDTTQPGIAPIVNYLASLPYAPNPNCAPNTYYYLNNTNPAYQPNGVLNTTGTFVPPLKSMRSIGDSLSDKGISWQFYGGAYNRALQGLGGYCQICNPFEYQTRFMADDAARNAHMKDTTDMYAEIANGTLPAVSFAHPDGTTDGHPQSSKYDLFEAYVKNILTKLAANPDLQASTLVVVTFDEGGGYYDSGFVQPVDFFGDGTRIPMIAVSKYSTGGKINHSYADQVSILKFIERNWSLAPVSSRSRDNLPNPQVGANAYVPVNSPAIDDLWDVFDFSQTP